MSLGGAAAFLLLVFLVLATAIHLTGDAGPYAAHGRGAGLGPAAAGATIPALVDPVVRDPLLAPLRRDHLDPQDPDAIRRATIGVTALSATGEHQAVYRVLGLPILPGEVIDLLVDADRGGIALRYAAGEAAALGAGRWRWTAPAEPGVYALRVEARSPRWSSDLPPPAGADAAAGNDWVHLNVFVVHPRDRKEQGALAGYPIGRYQRQPLRDDPVYQPPVGFAAVSPAAEDILVVPRFTVGQFLCKQPGDPRFLVLSPPLYLKLEALLEALNEAGYPLATLHVMSGYRTPHYNRVIGNRTVYSRHLYGDAADIYADVDGDGSIDHRDARILYRFIEQLEGSEASCHEHVIAGGLGMYRTNAIRPAYVHVDARGWHARW